MGSPWNLDIDEFMQAEGPKYKIRLPANSVLQESMSWLFKRPLPTDAISRYPALPQRNESGPGDFVNGLVDEQNNGQGSDKTLPENSSGADGPGGQRHGELGKTIDQAKLGHHRIRSG
jgi:hypothetical protein